MPSPNHGGVETQGHSSVHKEEDYYTDEEEEYYEDDGPEINDDKDDDDDDDIVLARNDENKENSPDQTIHDKITKSKSDVKNKLRNDVEDVHSTNASVSRGSVASQQHVLQQQQHQEQQLDKNGKSKQTKSGGLCSGRSSSAVKETQLTAKTGQTQKGDSEPAKTEEVETKEGTQVAQKRSGGLCRGNKNVEVKDSLRPVNAPPQSTDDPKKQEEPGKDTSKATSDQQQKEAKVNEKGAKKSGGLCGGKKSVEVVETASQEIKPEETSKPNAKKHTEREIPQTKNGTEKPGPKKSGGLCGGKSGVEVKDSLSPAENPYAETKENEASLNGNQRIQEYGSEDEQQKVTKKKGKKTKAKAKKGVEKEQPLLASEEEQQSIETYFDDDPSMTEIYVGPEPPPPTLKKGKKKKKGNGSYVKDEPLEFGNKKGKYEVTMAENETPTKKKLSKTRSGATSRGSQDSPLEDEERGRLPPKKKKKKLPLETDPELDVRSVYESQLAEVEALPLHEDTIEFTTDSLQPTFEDENELLENAKQERHKNKQRLREKKMREKEFESPVKESDGVARAYSSAQRELARVLQPGDSTEKEDGKKKSKDKKKKGKENEGYEDTEVKESLSEARDKMHQLLDDAFSLISQSRSSMASKPGKSKKDSDDSEEEKKKKSKKSKKRADTPPSQDEAPQEEKKHTPLYVQRTHGPYDSSGLISWSPYSAADEVNTIISLPAAQTQQPPYIPRQEKTSTSVFSEQLPANIKHYYTNEPAEPIVINTRNLDASASPYQKMESYKPSPSDGSYAPTGIGATRGTFQNPTHSSALPYTMMDRYSEPYHGMSSFQEIPQRDTDPVISGDRRLPSTDPYPSGNSRSADATNRSDGNVIMVQEHRPPQSRERPNQDVADVIYDSMRPGTSPQPLINSLRDELQGLSHRRATEGDGRHNSTLLETSAGNTRKTNGTTKRHSLLGSREGTPPEL